MNPLLTRVKDLVKGALPEKTYDQLRKAVLLTAMGLNYRLVNVSYNRVYHGVPSYDYDALMTVVNCDFMQNPRFVAAYQHYEATHINPWFIQHKIYWRVHVMLWATTHLKHVEGDFVECGVYRGASARAIIDYLNFGSLNKTYYLLDTYAGIEEKYLTEGERQRRVNLPELYEADYYQDVVNTFKDFSNVKIIRGPVPDTLPLVQTEKVAYLSLDMNNVTPEIAAADYFWDKLVPGGIIISDDYGLPAFPYTKIGFDEFAARKGVEILRLPTGQGLIFKPLK